jgi:general secretion pathway protein G
MNRITLTQDRLHLPIDLEFFGDNDIIMLSNRMKKPESSHRRVCSAGKRRATAGFTLIELMAVVAILGILTVVAMPRLFAATEKARYARGIREIKNIHMAIEQYRLAKGTIPLTMTDLIPLHFSAPPVDPWGNPYVYGNFAVITPGARRKDGPLVPINKEYDIYSAGPNGISTPNIRSNSAQDDIIFAQDGGFINVATEY